MDSGIYAIVNLGNGKLYVGSAVDLARRKKKHFSELRCARHPSKHLQASWNKHGEAAFEFSVLEHVADPGQLLAREQHWIDTLRPAYNKRTFANSNLGLPKSPEERAKHQSTMAEWAASAPGAAHMAALAEHNKKLWADPEHRAQRIAAIKTHWTEERRAEQSRVSKDRAAHMVDGVHFGTHRVWTDEEKQRSGAKLKTAWETRAPVSEADIRAMVTAANPAWTVVALTGLRSLDKVSIHCETHGHTQWQTIAKVRHAQRGCKLCGYQRSSETQAGRPKKPSEIS